MADSCTELEQMMLLLVEKFYKYVPKGKEEIRKSDFREMLQKELNHMLTATGSKEAANKLIQDLDTDHNGRISFDEYWTLIGSIVFPLINHKLY
ncbi:protein S100-A16-like [Sorex araneus]|uniref:protein S100-A16-like n=1 Tax=Sorex araneus TaxID=42254 RepID=UPI0024334F92|nr:protein S100-A16-like [Sorex araneus]